jgi:hypothetical protein
MILHTWQFIVVAPAGWLNQQQQDIVAYPAARTRLPGSTNVGADAVRRALPGLRTPRNYLPKSEGKLR